MSLPVQIYSAESKAKHLGDVVRDMARGIVGARYVAYRLARKDIKDAYATSAFGVVWDLLDPLVLASIFYFLMRASIISTDDLGMPASVFVVYGMMLYQTYAESVTLSVEILNRSKNLMAHLKIPPEALILSVFYPGGRRSRTAD